MTAAGKHTVNSIKPPVQYRVGAALPSLVLTTGGLGLCSADMDFPASVEIPVIHRAVEQTPGIKSTLVSKGLKEIHDNK